jgi:DNA-binding transcriptional LysR family regulator
MIDSTKYLELESSYFKAFLHAARELNFTRAAEKAAMTQSGVSQQIDKLEKQLGLPLFHRINKNVTLSQAGRLLLDYVESHQDSLGDLFNRLGISERSLSGKVGYAMPHSCLFTPHFPLLLQARKNFPEVDLKVTLCSNEEIVQLLLKREIDFGFLTQKSNNPALSHELFAVEEYLMVASPEWVRNHRPKLEEISNHPFVSYPGMGNLFDTWKRHYLPKKRNLSSESLKIHGEINSLNGAVTMLTHGMGLSVVPSHVVQQEIKRNQLEILSFGNRTKVQSEICIVQLKDLQQPERVKVVLNEFELIKK